MKTSLWRAVLVSLAASIAPFAAHAQLDSCSLALSNAAYSGPVDTESAKLRCDLERAALIRNRATLFYGGETNSLVEIIDTASPSGAAYVYNVLDQNGTLSLDARSVPDGKGMRCRLRATLPDDTANSLSMLLASAADPQLPDYGPREEVTLNPDGSRTVRLVIESHDVITRAQTPGGTRQFSRHAGSDDPINRLNNLVIGFANVSPAWDCKAS
ncbi:MAG: hypothetical protein FP825_07840 [Hyphomonas sp.]|uniref:hypothetical protein n=1 Tax=Hyphomonas sp. TaxID=87 RepID=UPI001839F03F|nr:hypothetical protein [Hyphomonas sp.]MBU3919979.1 hypothetical protein [Alphaproteobacteria bacterium]MBA3068373.1 hypothetical protein [Hyphomonas sp.]MBU4060760.1 hypothetical protein [Alphaproteobacteria bacterium]MBU4164744.1 hypothetical protein [Alphaproteobacteria bacterium]MBU4568110.1 hypothetical protein [Alphaproteobacteria bacterium]